MDYYAQYNQISHNTIWKIFTTNQMDKQIFIDHSDIKGRNVEVSGYPGSDDLIDKNYIPQQVWKPHGKKMKKIIWAPHHSFEKDSPIRWSTFLVFADFMQNMAIKYSQEIQFSFRPHPFLKDKLYELDSWGKQKTDDFYHFWETSENTQSDMVSYTDLFLTSDAIIHDSGSFMAEYLYVNKPSLYLIADETLTQRFSPFGVAALGSYSHGKAEEDIELFIQNDVINENDSMVAIRNEFIRNHLLQSDSNQIPSDFIFQYLEKALCLK
jgi:CDP-glycerol glycerophosphotransferase (TagB/SpsB family)